jgi:Flp pilus assembly protein TadG
MKTRTFQRSRKRTAHRHGQALVEFVLILPLLLLLVFGLIDFARAWSAHHAIADAAREGARMLVVHDPGVGIADAQDRIEDRLSAARLKVASADISFWRNGEVWASGAPSRGDTITVTIDYGYEFWIVGPLLGWAVGDRTVNLVSSITMRGE